ncbi:M20/M25/M40 family metallo-hydrolase [Candidatus Micrarchaeota archaeon]|nr:M20/M25/M40 family metallo-hydrolase [Candidatus Micrarchaeota archaeon]
MSILQKLVSINSIFPNEREIAEFIESSLKESGFDVKRQYVNENRFNVLAERGESGSPIMFYGHMDTVPVYGDWNSDPFELIEKNRRLYGLGVYDMKAGIAAILNAVQEKTDRKIKVAFGVDEENNSAGAWKLFENGFLQGVEGIVTTEIGDVQDESLAGRVITLGRRGRAVFEFKIPGRSVHGAHSNGQANATSEAAKLVLALEEMNEELPSHELLPKASQFVSLMESKATSLSTPSEAVVVLDRHMVVPETIEDVLNGYKAYLDRLYSEGRLQEIDGRKVRVSVRERKEPYLMPYYTSKENEFVRRFSELIEEPFYNTGYSVADECILASTGIPLLSLAPVGGNEHSANEWVSKNSYLEMTKVLRKFIRSM